MGTIKYNVVPKKDPVFKTKKYYALKAPAPRILTEQLMDYMAANSKVPRAHVPAALNAILKSIQQLVLNGHSVKVPGLGTFRPVIKSKGAESAEAFNPAKNITGVMVRFRVDKFYNDINRAGIYYEKLNAFDSIGE